MYIIIMYILFILGGLDCPVLGSFQWSPGGGHVFAGRGSFLRHSRQCKHTCTRLCMKTNYNPIMYENKNKCNKTAAINKHNILRYILFYIWWKKVTIFSYITPAIISYSKIIKISSSYYKANSLPGDMECIFNINNILVYYNTMFGLMWYLQYDMVVQFLQILKQPLIDHPWAFYMFVNVVSERY